MRDILFLLIIHHLFLVLFVRYRSLLDAQTNLIGRVPVSKHRATFGGFEWAHKLFGGLINFAEYLHIIFHYSMDY